MATNVTMVGAVSKRVGEREQFENRFDFFRGWNHDDFETYF